MDSIYHYLSETQVVWEQFNFSKSKDFAVTEIWSSNDDKSDALVTIHRNVSKEDLSGWLYQTNGTYQWLETGFERKCMFRAVWVLRDTKQRLDDIDANLMEEISIAFRHQLARNYRETQFAGIGSTIDDKTSEKTYFLCNHPKLAVTWSKHAETEVTNMICVADRYKISTLKDLAGCKFIQDLAHLKAMPALMSAILSSKEIDMEAGAVKKSVREVEVRTGYHEWVGRAEGSARGDMVGLSAKMSGCGARIESNTRKLGVIMEFCQFIRVNLEEEMNIKSRDEMLSLNRIIEKRTAMQTLDLKYVQYRTRTQKEALFNLISANDSASSRIIADESRQIALATKSDAQSMKLLALMTTIFLPGTFISGLFSTPIFQRGSKDTTDDADIKVWRPGLFLYIAVSCPLLVLTLLTWGIWTFGQRLKNERHVKATREHLFQGTRNTEKENLIMKHHVISQETI